MALEPPSDSVGDVLAADEDEGLLGLSTIHSAKGLEWHTVFVIWVVDGKFPSSYTMHDDEELEEERRLLYVAVTRAKQNLLPHLPDQHVRPQLGHGARRAVALRRRAARGYIEVRPGDRRGRSPVAESPSRGGRNPPGRCVLVPS